MNDKKGQSTQNSSNLVRFRLLFICWKDLAKASLLPKVHQTLGFEKMISCLSNKWKSVKVSITLSFLLKLIKFYNLVKVGYKDDISLAIFEYCVYQGKTLDVN